MKLKLMKKERSYRGVKRFFFLNYISYNLITGFKIKTLELDKTPNFLSNAEPAFQPQALHIFISPHSTQ